MTGPESRSWCGCAERGRRQPEPGPPLLPPPAVPVPPCRRGPPASVLATATHCGTQEEHLRSTRCPGWT